MRPWLHRLLRHKHRRNYHLWDADPNRMLAPGTMWHKCTCVRCGYAIDVVYAQELFAVWGHPRTIPGRVAESDEYRQQTRRGA